MKAKKFKSTTTDLPKIEVAQEIESIANQNSNVNLVFLRKAYHKMSITFDFTVGSMKFTYYWKAYSKKNPCSPRSRKSKLN